MEKKLFSSKTGLYASEIILGAASFGTQKGHGTPPDEAFKILSAYTDAGGNFIDTSDRYQYGESEEIIGKFIEHQRNDFIICTKYTQSSEINPKISNIGNHRKAMRQAVDSSLKRLRTDYIDIYMPHFDDGVTPIDEIIRGLEDLVSAGKILYTGLTNFPAWKVASIATLSKLTALEIAYNLLQRTAEREFLAMAEQFGLGIMMYSPLAGGILSGKYRTGEVGRLTVTANLPYKEDEITKKILDKLFAIAEELEVTPSTIAFAWVRSKRAFPILGARTMEQFSAALKGYATKLSEQHILELDQLSKVSLGYPHDLLNMVRSQK